MSLRLQPKGSRRNRHPTNIRHFGDERTLGERIADDVAARVGSWPFIIIQTVLLLMWLVANGFLIHSWLGGKPFDPFPFILLNLLLSFQAAYTGPVVMMSQNRQSARDRDEAEHDYEINREAFAALEKLQQDQARIKELLERLTKTEE
jgi:uncharacterized membrane protein